MSQPPPFVLTSDTTVDDIEESLSHLVAAARTADERGNDLLYGIMHRRIDTQLSIWEKYCDFGPSPK